MVRNEVLAFIIRGEAKLTVPHSLLLGGCRSFRDTDNRLVSDTDAASLEGHVLWCAHHYLFCCDHSDCSSASNLWPGPAPSQASF